MNTASLKTFLKLISPPPALVVILVAFLVVCVSAFVRSRNPPKLDPRVTLEGQTTAELQRVAQESNIKIVNFGADDPSVRYAERLRDATALTMTLGLYVVNERVSNKKIVPSVKAALDGLAASSLMPPGMTTLNSSGVVRSEIGLYYVRYRPSPFGLEVLSVGAQGMSDGAVFIVRLPEASTAPATGLPASQIAGAFAGLFVAPPYDAPVPKPFVPAASIARMGWKQEPLRSNPLSPQQWTEMQTWLAQNVK